MDIADTLPYDGEAVAAEASRPSEIVIDDDNPVEALVCLGMPERPAGDSPMPEPSQDTRAVVQPADDSATPESSHVAPVAVVGAKAAGGTTVPESSDVTPIMVETPMTDAHGSEDVSRSSAVECDVAAIVTEDAQGSKAVGQPAREVGEDFDGPASPKPLKKRVPNPHYIRLKKYLHEAGKNPCVGMLLAIVL